MAVTVTNYDAALKRYYGPQKILNATFASDDRPAINFAPKDLTNAGKAQDFPIITENAFGRAATDSVSITNAGNPTIAAWAVTVVGNFQTVDIDTQVLKAARNDPGTFLKTQFLRIDTSLEVLANDLEIGVFGYDDGRIGTISAITSTTITLANAADARQFFQGQVLVSAPDATMALTAGTTTVTGVNYTTGVLTVDTDVSGTWGAPDLIFTQGDYVSAADSLKMAGFETWLGTTAALFGVTRTAHSRLLGVNTTGALADVKKAITDTAALLKAQASSKPTLCFVPWDGVFDSLVNQLEADVFRTPGPMATAGFSGVKVFGPSGPIKVVGATHCTPNTIYLIDESVWKIVSMGSLVRINNDSGLMAHPRASNFGIQVRADAHTQNVLQGPGKCARVVLS